MASDAYGEVRSALEQREDLDGFYERYLEDEQVRSYVMERLRKEPGLWEGRRVLSHEGPAVSLYDTPRGIDLLCGRRIVDVRADMERGAEFDAEPCEVFIETGDGSVFLLFHSQECCEDVRLIDGLEDLKELVGEVVVSAREESNQEWDEEQDRSSTYTFYHLRTAKHDATLRWLGESNGYYSERVEVAKVAIERVAMDA